MSIYKKLLEVQKEVGAISKDSDNPFFKSKYFDINKLIEHVNPILSKHDLLLLQPIKDNKVQSIIFDEEQNIISELELPKMPDPQKLGSAITYYRRYTLASLLGLQAEDDDGNIASKEAKKTQKIWLTDDQFNKALKGSIEGVKATLNVYNGRGNKCMKLDQKQQLEKLIK